MTLVGANGILVHNKSKTSKYQSTERVDVDIYVVRNSQTGEVVYVGQTQQDLDTRFEQHIAEGQKKGTNNPKYEWGDPRKYSSEVIDSGHWDPYEAAVWEQHYIEKYGGKDKLVNARNEITEKKFDLYGDLHNPC